jgi:hypothetical protein
METKPLIKELAEKLEKDSIVVLAVVNRTSEGFYNYKTDKVYVLFKPRYPRYEESLVRDIEVVMAYVGAYQELSEWDIEDIIRELGKQYEVHEAEIC